MPPAERAVELWDALLAAGAVPCGLAARDSLRLEAGLHLYGNDLDDTTTPIEAGLGWTIDWDHDFRGRDALAAITAARPARRFVALEAGPRAIPRQGSLVTDSAGAEIGVVTSGTFSPTLEKGIGLAYVRAGFTKPGTSVGLLIRDKQAAATVVKRPFYASV
jgi:aminomethyltransferase